MRHFIAIGEFKNLSYSPETLKLGQILQFFVS